MEMPNCPEAKTCTCAHEALSSPARGHLTTTPNCEMMSDTKSLFLQKQMIHLIRTDRE